LTGALDSCNFLAIQTDGSTDSANMKKQLNRKSVSMQSCYLYEGSMRGLDRRSAKDWENKLVTLRCDGAVKKE